MHLQVKTPESHTSWALSTDFSWDRSLADKKHLLGGIDEEVEKRRDSASAETSKPQSLREARWPQLSGGSCVQVDSHSGSSFTPKATNDKRHRKTN